MNLVPNKFTLPLLLFLSLLSCKNNEELIKKKNRECQSIQREISSCQADIDATQFVIDSLKRQMRLQFELGEETHDSSRQFQQMNQLASWYIKVFHPDPDSLIDYLVKLDPKQWQLLGVGAAFLGIWGQNKQARIDSVQVILNDFARRMIRCSRKGRELDEDKNEYEEKLNKQNQQKANLVHAKEACLRDKAALE